MTAWPNFVPRIEWDVHIKSINEHLSHLSQRLANHNEQHDHCGVDRDRLHSWCKDLACKAELTALGSRLDLQVACCDSSLVDSMQEVREHFGLEMQKLRDDLQGQIDTLRVGLSGAAQDISRLDESVKTSVHLSETTYATKDEQNTLRESLARTSYQMHIDLSKSIDAVALEKASRSQLDEAKVSLRSADERLGRDLAAASASLAQTAQSLSQVEKEFRSLFATRTDLGEVLTSMSGLAQRVSEGAEARLNLHKQFDNERDRLRENVAQVQECWRVVAETADDICQLRVGRNLCIEKCDKSERGLEAVSQLEKNHWDDIQVTMASHQQHSIELRGVCDSLRKDLIAHIEMTRQDGEKIRQYSTTRYMDQLDKALRLHQTVEQVQQGQVKLQESMRTSFLPKMS